MTPIENPIREQIKLDNLWHVRHIGHGHVSVFIPSWWAGLEIVLQGGIGEYQPPLACGQWNPLLLGPVSTVCSRLVARPARHIESLEASWASGGSVSVRVGLTGGPRASMLLTLTAVNGRQLGVREVTAEPEARNLSLEMPLVLPVNGPSRLKVSLSQGGQVVDNARIDLGQAESTRR